MTHIENVSHILQYGITHITSPNFNSLYKSIGDGSLISKRHSVVLPNNNRSISDYIPFYFGGRMPMLYVIQNRFNDVPITNPQDIIYFVTNVTLVQQHQLHFVFSNGHGVSKLTKFYNEDDISNIENLVDFIAIKDNNWKKDGDNDFKRRKEAEFLIEPDIPYSVLGAFIVYNEFAKNRLIEMGVTDDKIKIDKRYYF